MELVLLIGIPATGKSTFCREKFYRTHLRVNLDMLRTRHREKLVFDSCLAGKTRVVVDNTNLSLAERARFIAPTRVAGFRVVGYVFESKVADAVQRNAARPTGDQIPEKAIPAASNRLAIPALKEGFDELFFVRLAGDNQFIVEPWRL